MNLKREEFPNECPEDACMWCYERGEINGADAEDGELCYECSFERAVSRADALHDQMKEGF